MKERNALLAIHLGALLFGLSGIFGKLANTAPMIITFGRGLFAVIALALFAQFIARGRSANPNLRQLAMLGLGGLLLGAHWITFFHAVQVAGVAIATTIASVMGEKPVRHDVAMTGEITLRGKVLSVGGIKEKVMAAQRANISTVLLPEGNRKDLGEVPKEIQEGLKFIFVNRVEDVWQEALIPLYVVKGAQRKYDQEEYDAEYRREET